MDIDDDSADAGADTGSTAGDKPRGGSPAQQEEAEAAEWAKFKANLAGRKEGGDKPAKDKGGKKPAAAKKAEDEAEAEADDAAAGDGDGEEGADDTGDEGDKDGAEADVDKDGDKDGAPPAKKKAAKKPKEGDKDDDTGDEGEKEGDKDDDEGEDDEGEDDEVELDAAGKKRLEAVQRQERRHKEQVEKDRKAIDAEAKKVQAVVDEWAPKIDRVVKLQKQVKTRPAAVVELLTELGLGADDFSAVGRLVYAASSEAAKDPKWKSVAQQLAKETGQTGEVAELRSMVERLSKQLEDRDARSRYEQDEARYLDSALARVKEAADAPLARIMLGKAPDKLRRELKRVAIELSQHTHGETPDHDDVLTEFERQRREQLEDAGVDVDALVATARKGKKPEAAKPERKPPRALPNAGAGAGRAKDDDEDKEPLTEAEEWAEFKRKAAERKRAGR
jgi:hypothetical protein